MSIRQKILLTIIITFVLATTLLYVLNVSHDARTPLKTSVLLEDIETMFSPLAARKNLKLSGTIALDVPYEMHGDIARIKQIINNLVDNAIKFTSAGHVNVSNYNKDSEHWAISMADSRIGVSPENIDKIFEAFWQADGSITRQANSGVGLGLSIVRQLAALMNGTVYVEGNCPAPGTTFRVELPYEKQLVL